MTLTATMLLMYAQRAGKRRENIVPAERDSRGGEIAPSFDNLKIFFKLFNKTF